MGKEQPWCPCGLLLLLGPDLSYPCASAYPPSATTAAFGKEHEQVDMKYTRGEDHPHGHLRKEKTPPPTPPHRFPAAGRARAAHHSPGNVGSRGQRRGGSGLAGRDLQSHMGRAAAPSGIRLQAAKQHLGESREAGAVMVQHRGWLVGPIGSLQTNLLWFDHTRPTNMQGWLVRPFSSADQPIGLIIGSAEGL